ncbi:hypothetical protein [Geminicoccus roseus]|uniref:hypothetical protein n=1 Tax=Geminicoccus roseus TaxID=404900 RepID=UPI00041F7267|nr:hypothetical protein [Geminicoccus roseus]
MLARNLLLGAAFAAPLALSAPASAQLAPGDVEIEGPMSEVSLQPGSETTTQGLRKWIGSIKVLGVTVRVLEGALIHTPTNAESVTLADFAASAAKLPGRTEGGFIGGTAIVVGESIGGQVYVHDVFSDLSEHVVVGEATNPLIVNDTVTRSKVNEMEIRPLKDARMPAGPAINGLGLKIKANAITTGTLVAAEGYYSSRQDVLWYHTLEADGAPLARWDRSQVAILRADCRVRGGGRDEISVRGGVVLPADGVVVISIPRPTNGWEQVGLVTAVPDPATGNPATGEPMQGEFRADFRGLTIAGGVCPTRVRASMNGTLNRATVTADMDGR